MSSWIPYIKILLIVGVLLSGIIVVSISFITLEEQNVEEQLSYQIENIPLPPKMSPEISAVTFTPAGQLVVANRNGEVWIRDLGESWRLFAYGLHEPLGLHAVSENSIYVAHRPEVTYLEDRGGDGMADTYETINDHWGVTDNWHEFTFGLPKDKERNLVISFGIADKAGPIREIYPRIPLDYHRVLDEYKVSVVPWQGWVTKISPSGALIPWASGFRQPAGVATSPDGEVFVTDQQGDWIASSNLIHVQEGRFYGHPSSLKWDKEFDPDEKMTVEKLEKMRTPPTVILPHGSIGGSPGEPVWDVTEGAFGPFTGQVFIGDFTKLLSRVYLEKVDGQYQGAVFPFIRGSTGADNVMAYSGADNLTIPAGGEGRRYFRDASPRSGTPLRPGNMKMAFGPDGCLYVGQTTRGWLKGAEEGLQRIKWTGHMPVELKTMELIEQGFELTFTTTMDRKLAGVADSYKLSRFRYLYSSGYGSPRVDIADVPILETRVSENGERVKLMVEELMPGFIYQIEIDKLSDNKGRPVEHPLAFYTLNRTLDGKQFKGKLSERMFEEKEIETERTGPDMEGGKRIFGTYCVACHGRDGRGSNDAPDFTSNDSPLQTKKNRALLEYIAGEKEETLKNRTMPAFGKVLNAKELEDVVYYLQKEFTSNY